MSKSIFVSCVHEDKHLIKTLEKWAVSGELGNTVFINAMEEDKRPGGVDGVKEYIQNKIRGAAIVLVLVGRDTHNHDWVRAEVELANSFHIKLICVRIPNTTGGKPQILANYKEITFTVSAIKEEL